MNMVNSVFGPQLGGGKDFEIDIESVPSKSKKMAQGWLDSTEAFSKDDIYQVSDRFSELLQNPTFCIPEDVCDRFGVLLDDLTRATEPEA